MAKRSQEEQALHRTLVGMVVEVRESRGWFVKAELDGWVKPPEIGGHVPDVWAEKTGAVMVVEVETCDTIHLVETKEQYRAFYRYAMPTPERKNREFRIYTPKACYEEALKQAEEWKVISFHPTRYFWHFEDL
ncbi:MAG: hypothetical protein ACE5IB_02765 [Candidatus Geothermarchaeales archaeon]